MYNHINKYSLINATGDEGVSENTLLFSVENLFMGNSDVKLDDIILFIEKLEVEEGLYNNLPSLVIGKDKFMSHDNITAIVSLSKQKGMSYHKLIWEWLKSHLMTYDNISKKTSLRRILHPRDMIYYGYCADSTLCRFLLPLLCIIMLISCLGKGSSGKMLNYVRCKGAGLKVTFWLCTQIIKLNKYFGSWKKVFNTYFPCTDHPNHME